MEDPVTGHEASLREYYDEEARRQSRHQQGPLRIELRRRFAELLRVEARRSVIDVGSGPGLDTVGFQQDGFTALGVDLSPENVDRMLSAGIDGLVGSLYDLPVEPGSFDAVWTMSALVHVPDTRFDEAMRSLTSATVPGAPIGIGTWGGFDWEGTTDRDEIVPARFFSLRAHERFPEMLAGHGVVELFETYRPRPDSDWEYQFAILRNS